MFNLGLGKSDNLLVKDACVLASRAIGGNDEDYKDMLNFVEGSQNGKAVVMFLKAYPDAYRTDKTARKVIDGYIANNEETAYGVHAKALSIYSLEKADFKSKNKTDMINAISIKNKEIVAYKKCDEIASAYSNKFGDEAEVISARKTKEAHAHLDNVKGIQERLGENGLAIESLLTEASGKYLKLAETQETYDALISRAESLAIKNDLGKATNDEIAFMSALLSKASKKPSVDIMFAKLMFDYETDAEKFCNNYSKIMMECQFGKLEISKTGRDCIELGADLIANAESSDAPDME